MLAKPKLPEHFEEDSWRKLQAAVYAIYNQTPIAESLEDLYRTCENLCHNKLGARLYTRLQGECNQRVQSILAKLVYEWHANIKSIWDMSMGLFCDIVVNDAKVGSLLLTGLLGMIEHDRNGLAAPHQLIRSLVKMYRNLSLYASHFEPPFLVNSEAFYVREGRQLVESMSVPEFLHHCKKRLEDETERLDRYLDAERTRGRLISTVEQSLISANMQKVLDKGCDSLLDSMDMDDLACLYAMCKRVERLGLLKDAFAAYIKRVGSEIVSDPKRDTIMVEHLLALKQRIDRVHYDAFEHAEHFGHAITESFESFINTRQNRPAEMIAHYVNVKMRSGNKLASDDELETLLDRVLVLFRFIEGKDVFEAFYKRDFAKRLLLNKSASSDMEKLMLTKLKAGKCECGPGFTSKLEGMFKDIDVSRDLTAMFRQSKWYKVSKDAELSVNVLTHGIWPTYHPMEITLPPKMAEYQDAFRQFYASQHKNRQLTWQHSLGHCLLRGHFPK
ncbi:Cullin, partial [Thamnocephalis sphaerospora]